MQASINPYPLVRVKIDEFEFTVQSFQEMILLEMAAHLRKLLDTTNRNGPSFNIAQAVRLSVRDDNQRVFWPPKDEKPSGPATLEFMKSLEMIRTKSVTDRPPQLYRNSAGEVMAARYTSPGDDANPSVVSVVHHDDPAFALLVPIPELAPRDPAWERESKKFREEHPNCLVCGTTTDCQVHHKYPVHLHPDKEMDPKFWRTLCRVHHLWWGHLGSWYSFNEHIDEDATAWHDKIKNRPKGTVPAG